MSNSKISPWLPIPAGLAAQTAVTQACTSRDFAAPVCNHAKRQHFYRGWKTIPATNHTAIACHVSLHAPVWAGHQLTGAHHAALLSRRLVNRWWHPARGGSSAVAQINFCPCIKSCHQRKLGIATCRQEGITWLSCWSLCTKLPEGEAGPLLTGDRRSI
jgi:hypothetical protein